MKIYHTLYKYAATPSTNGYATPFCKHVVARMWFSRLDTFSRFQGMSLYMMVCASHTCGSQRILDNLEAHILMKQNSNKQQDSSKSVSKSKQAKFSGGKMPPLALC